MGGWEGETAAFLSQPETRLFADGLTGRFQFTTVKCQLPDNIPHGNHGNLNVFGWFKLPRIVLGACYS